MTRKTVKRPAPKVVPLHPHNVSELAREHGISRSTVRERLRKGWQPAVANEQRREDQPQMPLAASPPAPPPLATHRHPIATPRLAGAILLAIAAMAVAGLALAINAQYGAAIGETVLTSWTFMGLAVAVDLLAVTLAPAAVGLWRTKQRGLAVATWATWGVAVFLATLATLGFFQKNLADTAATRAATVTLAAATQDQRSEVIAAAKLAVSVAKASREAECAARGPRCLQREADERTAVNALAIAVASPLVSPAKISDPDPQIAAASHLAAWAGLRLRPDDFANTRLVLWSFILNSGGLVLAIAFGLARSRGSA
jgi:transposase-like protein